MRRDIRNMAIAITGASSGIGRALAHELHRRGARLILAARRLDRLEQLNTEFGGVHHCLQCDISDDRDCKALVDCAVRQFGRIDTLVCNAGYALARPFDLMTANDIQRVFQVNLIGTMECCRQATRAMKTQAPRDGFHGQIMMVSSACARRGLPFMSTYGASKAAQLSMAEGLRIELAPLGIAVTSVHPQIVETDFFTTIQKQSGMNPAALIRGGRQSAAAVAARMARAIEKPRRELWTLPWSRLALTIAIAFPSLADFFMARIRDRMLTDNGRSQPRPSAAPSGDLAQTDDLATDAKSALFHP